MQRRRDERGAAVVEFALILPMLVLFVFGIVEFGRAYSARIQLTRPCAKAPRAVALGGTPTQAADATKAGAPGLTPTQVAGAPRRTSLRSVATPAANATVSATLPLPVHDPPVPHRHVDPQGDRSHAMRRLSSRRAGTRRARSSSSWPRSSPSWWAWPPWSSTSGSVLDEKRQLQNGADAAALAVAQHLAKTCPRHQHLHAGIAADTVGIPRPAQRPGRLDSGRRAGGGLRHQAGDGDTRTRTPAGRTILPYSFAQALAGGRKGHRCTPAPRPCGSRPA